MMSNDSSEDRMRRAVERSRALYRADPEGFERETDRLAKEIEGPEPPSIYEWEPHADPHEQSVVDRRVLIEAIRRMDAGERAFPDESANG
jgi:hypothetical protein